ncbi:hypothetical protein PM082_015451 [Marasmius tenuissimus]|nr:hypothetical protein PM082_015451 [Marasmius tenuissimus]
MVYIDQVGFRLEGIFLKDPTTCPEPAYLFVLPPHYELINGMHCVHYPFPKNLFYWSSDLHGRDKIAEEDWERLGIPKLSVEGFVGTSWQDFDYTTVWEVLWWKNYNLDGKQYAREYGYPELILGDPHDSTKIEDLDDSEPLNSDVQPSTLQLTSPSTYSLVETPPDSHVESENTPSLPNETMVAPTRWVKGFLNKYYSKLSVRQMKASSATGTVKNSDDWDLIEGEDV